MIVHADKLKETPWLDYEPGDWTRFRVKDIAALSPPLSEGAPAPTETCTVVPMESLSVTGDISYEGQADYRDVSSGLPNFENGDVLFAKITPCMENGKGSHVVGLPTRYAFGSTEFHVLRPGHRVDARFLYYYTFNPIFRRYAAENMTGAAGQKRVSSRFLNYTPIWLPGIHEQGRIAAYLDNACKAIDGAIGAKRKQLDTLADLRKSIIHKAVTRGLDDSVEMKPSGVDWLGEIPAHWGVQRLKDIADIRYGLGQPPAESQEGIPMIRATNVDAGRILDRDLLRIDKDDLPLGRNPYLQAEEIIVVRSGAYTGDSAIIPPEYAGAVAGYDMVVTARKAAPEFVAYALLSYYVLDAQILLLTLRAAQPHLNAEQLGSIRVLVPASRDEQRLIAAHIASKLKKVERVSRSLTEQIRTLQDYRKSLIHECVTGKRRIRDADIQKVKEHV